MNGGALDLVSSGKIFHAPTIIMENDLSTMGTSRIELENHGIESPELHQQYALFHPILPLIITRLLITMGAFICSICIP